MHYKDYRLCYINTLGLFGAIFLLAKGNVFASYVASYLASIVMSEKCNVENWFLYENKRLENIKKYIYNNNKEDIKIFEDKLKEKKGDYYQIYKYKMEGKTNIEIANIINVDTRRISEKVQQIDFAMSIFFNESNYKEK